MNIGIIEKHDFFEIGLLIKKTYDEIKSDEIKYITILDDNKIDILIIDKKVNEALLKTYIEKLHNESIIIVNVDDKELVKIISNYSYNIVSFGFNPKASITLSSFQPGIKDTSLFCIQRDLTTISKKEVIEQEFLVNSTNINEFDLLLTASVLLILDININQINDAFSKYYI